MDNWFWWVVALIILLAIASMIRSRRRKPRPGLYDSAMPKDGTPESPTRTIRRQTTVTPGTHFPMDEVRRSDDGEGDFATSAMVTAATGSLPSGAIDCGSGISAGIGSDCGGGGD